MSVFDTFKRNISWYYIARKSIKKLANETYPEEKNTE